MLTFEGPLIGYFISRAKMAKLKKGNIDSVYRTFIEIVQSLGGTAFLFCADSINPTTLSIKGYTFEGPLSSTFVEKIYPIPKVIYNRCFGSKSEGETEELLSSVKDISLIINPYSKNKSIFAPLLKDTQEEDPAIVMGYPVELKVLVQKDWQGIWHYTGGAVCLKAQDNPILSASFFDLDNTMEELFSEHEKIKEAVVTESLDTAKEAELILPNLLELEIGLEISNTGKSSAQKISIKPSKKFISRFKHSESFIMSILRPAAYCFRLAGFPLQEDPKPDTRLQDSGYEPLIGIFEGLECLDAIRSNTPFPYQLNLAKAGRELNCQVYHFSIRELKGPNEILGWYYNSEQGVWTEKTFPWPDVFYDRGTFSKIEDRQKAKDFRKQLRKAGKSLLLNTKSVFGKGSTGFILDHVPGLQNYLPKTYYCPEPPEVLALLEKHPSVFIKTEYGSQHSGVWELKYSEGLFHYKTFNKSKSFESFEQLWSEVKELVASEGIIAQQGIDAVPYQGKTLGFRALVQKNGSGRWEAALLKPWLEKTAESPSIPMDWRETMLDLFSCPKLVEHIYQRMCEVSLHTAKILEAYLGPLAELGVDLIIDGSGHPWLIEVNGKSAKIFFVEQEIPEIQHRVYFNPIAYGKYIAKNFWKG